MTVCFNFYDDEHILWLLELKQQFNKYLFEIITKSNQNISSPYLILNNSDIYSKAYNEWANKGNPPILRRQNAFCFHCVHK